MQENLDTRQALAALESPWERERLYAAEELGLALAPETAVPMARQLIREESQIVRDALVYNLKHMDATAAYESLFSLFALPDAYLRNAAVSIFGGDGDDSIAFLSRRFDGSDKEVRKLILDSMAEIGTPAAVRAIRAGLRDPAPNVRITAVEYLGRLSDLESMPEFLSLLEDDPEPMLRSAVMEALLSLADGPTLRQVARFLAPQDGRGPDPLTLPQFFSFLARVGTAPEMVALCGTLPDAAVYAEEIIGALVELWRRGARVASAETFDMLASLARDPGLREDLRMTALRLLSSAWNDEARPIISGVAAESGDADVRQFCAELLGEKVQSEGGMPDGYDCE